MKVDKIKEAIYEAERFITKAKLALEKTEGKNYLYANKENGACRRSSMDLTRALAELRK